ncbi:L,D-transpeptidase [Methylocapsa acidiphila]|uniref:L,D-transpeptidase n=1 Tax=Methylocapsa acidiphila TaxID=133552 RepID=UPI000422DCD8|nr:L,D-transpeptidase [Methylocapsa acidiphila]
MRRPVASLALKNLSLLAAGVSFFVFAEPASAQWRNYYGYQAYPSYPPYDYPAYPNFFPADPPPPYVGNPYRYGQPAAPAPAYEPGDPYAPRAGARGYREPSGQEDVELGVNFRERTATTVQNPTREPPGTIVIDTRSRHLYLVQSGGGAIQYGIGVGRQGFEWKGVARVGRKAEWPRWIPPKEMLQRRPDLPEQMDGGIENPLGARALYLYQGDKDTLFRIHGTNEPDSIGKAVSSGCIRMMNADVIDLYQRVGVGARVVVL